MYTRRHFLVTAAGAGASVVVGRPARAMQTTQSFAGPMQQDAYRPVKLGALPGARASMSDEKRDALEHQIKCQCGCVLDVYTCRTTDFACSVSPAMHGDVVALVAGGHNAAQILAAFQGVYGEQILMAPVRRGFNLVGYALPSVALLTAGVAVAALIRRWGTRGREIAQPIAIPLDATPEELRVLDDAVRNDS